MKTISLTLMSVAALAAQMALAHTELAETVPADRATLAAAPENVELRFSEPVRLTALSVQKDGEQKQSLGPLPSATMESFSVALPATLDEGHYVVTWRALSEDTHVMSGEFMFGIGADAGHDTQMNHGAELNHDGQMNHGAEVNHDAQMNHGAEMNHSAMPAGEHHEMPAAEGHADHNGVH